MMKNLIIIGAGGFGREVAWLVERINKVSLTWNILGFLDDNEAIENSYINGYKVLGKIKDIALYPDVCCVCAVGSSQTRQHIVNNINSINPNTQFAVLIDPTVEISDRVTLGEGTIICAHSIVTVNLSIGKHVIINLDCTVGHDVILNDFVTLYPSVNVSGMVNVGYCSELGTGMQIIQGKNIGEHSIVGAGAVVMRDIPANCTALGNPARPVKFQEAVKK